MREAGELERKKKLRKKEERRKAEERERERKGKEYFNERGERSIINFFFLALNYSAHLKIDVHCDLAPLLHNDFLVYES